MRKEWRGRGERGWRERRGRGRIDNLGAGYLNKKGKSWKRLRKGASSTSLRNRIEGGLGSVLIVESLWEGGSHIGHAIRSGVILPKDMIKLKGAGHEKLGFPM